MDTNNIAENTTPIIEPTPPTTEKVNLVKKVNPKLATIVVVVLLLIGAGYYFRNLWIAATVDGHIVTRLAVIKKLELQNGKTVLDGLIENQMIHNAAKKQNIVISDDEINKKLETVKTQVESSGTKFEDALSSSGLTEKTLKQQIALQLKLEKLLGDRINITDEEVNKYVTDNQVTFPDGQEDVMKAQIKDQLKTEKFNTEAVKYVEELRASAKIKTYVNYK